MSEEIYDTIEDILDDVLATRDATGAGVERAILSDCIKAFRTMRADNERFIERIADMADAWYGDDGHNGADDRRRIVEEAKAGDKESIEYMKAWPMVFSDEEHEEVDEEVAVKAFKRDWKARRLSTKGGDE